MATISTLPLHIKGLWEAAYNMSPDQPNFGADIAREESTDSIQEKLAWLSSLAPAAAVNEGDAITVQSIFSPYTKVYQTGIYSVAVKYTKRQLRTDQTGMLDKVGKLLNESVWRNRQMLIADILNNRTDSSYAGIDGVSLANASHPTDSGTWSNLTTAVTGTSIGTIERMKDDIRINHKQYTAAAPWINPTTYNLVAGIDISEQALLRILAGTEQPGTSDREVNVARRGITFNGCNPFVTGSVLSLIPTGESNPLFLLVGKNKEVREDMESGKGQAGHPITYVAEWEATTGWKYAQGVQFGTGG